MLDKTKAIKKLREYEGGQHNKYDENIDFVKERGTETPFKCIKCDHRTNAKAHITRHLFTKHSSAVINRRKKAVPAKHAKRARSEVAKDRTVPEQCMRKEIVKRFRLIIKERDNLNETFQEDNRKLDDLVARSAQAIIQIEEKVETE